MQKDIRYHLLVVFSVLTVGTLSAIQYSLIRNTYRLTSLQYEAEVKEHIARLNSQAMADTLQRQAFSQARALVADYLAGQLSKAAFIQQLRFKIDSANQTDNRVFHQRILRDSILYHTSYQARWDAVRLEFRDHTDTLLSASGLPVIIIGGAVSPKGALRLSQSTTASVYDRKTVTNGRIRIRDTFTLHIDQSEYIDLSMGNREVWHRMLSVLLGAIALIVAVGLLFFLTFRALVRQKKIADIRTDLANNITHELKTPLASLAIISKSLAKPEIRNDPELQDELLLTLDRQQLKLNQIVDSVLESALRTPVETRLVQTDLNALLQDVVSDFQALGRSLETFIERGETQLNTDPVKLAGVIRNLLDNAVKYSPPQSRIVLKAFTAEGHYLVQVTDEGAGIAPEQQSLVFDKFYRVLQSNRHQAKGLGLGLYLGRETIRRLGGTLTLQSALGKGSTFTITLPLI